MNVKVLAYQLGAVGSAMAGSGGVAAVVLPSEIDPTWAKIARNACVVVWLLGVALSAFSKWMMAGIKATEEAETAGTTQTVQLPPRPSVPPVAVVLGGVLLLGMTGCCDERRDEPAVVCSTCTAASCGGVSTPKFKVNADEK